MSEVDVSRWQFLDFRGGPADGSRVGWTGPWPPPEQMTHVQGPITGNGVFTAPVSSWSPATRDAIGEGNFVLTSYRREDCSNLSDEVIAMGNIARGAFYRAET